jgi:hypothetical protein
LFFGVIVLRGDRSSERLQPAETPAKVEAQKQIAHPKVRDALEHKL